MYALSEKTIQKLNKFKFWNLSQRKILSLLEDRYRWPIEYLGDKQPTIEVIGLDKKLIFNEDLYLNVASAKNFYDQGYTLIISRVNTLTKEIRNFSDIIFEELNRPFGINLYISKGKKVISFPHHNHHYDVFVKNVSGESLWINGNRKEYLKSQNYIKIPKFQYHQVIEINKPKISLTCNLD